MHRYRQLSKPPPGVPPGKEDDINLGAPAACGSRAALWWQPGGRGSNRRRAEVAGQPERL